MTIFDNEDDAYVNWLETHQQGFVINSFRHYHPGYLILHRATCKSISRTAPEPIRWTSGDYIKVCSDNLPELERWARETGKGSLQPCGMCHPL